MSLKLLFTVMTLAGVSAVFSDSEIVVVSIIALCVF